MSLTAVASDDYLNFDVWLSRTIRSKPPCTRMGQHLFNNLPVFSNLDVFVTDDNYRAELDPYQADSLHDIKIKRFLAFIEALWDIRLPSDEDLNAAYELAMQSR